MLVKTCMSKLCLRSKNPRSFRTGSVKLDQSLGGIKPQRVRVIVLFAEDEETDPDETPTEIVIEGIRQGLHEALTGKTIPLSEMWEGIDAE